MAAAGSGIGESCYLGLSSYYSKLVAQSLGLAADTSFVGARYQLGLRVPEWLAWPALWPTVSRRLRSAQSRLQFEAF